MIRLLTLALGLLALVNIRPIAACEIECMTGVTVAFFGNYSRPVGQVFLKLATQISDAFSLQDDLPYYLQPINDTFHNNAIAFHQHSIFPSYFHGKCQDPKTGQNPNGCPNPSCAVVCGTPGSLVYHFLKLRTIVHDATKALFDQTTDPSSRAYAESSTRIYRATQSGTGRSFGPSLRFSGAYDIGAAQIKDANFINHTLSRIFKGFSQLLDDECGGIQAYPAATLPRCNWEHAMKAYILTFP
ncbi:hypothetical protein P691DRAFT_725687 [Macrolepiota fuliginosa MF-IS2]|uniref:Uncharacterized protein n=1 Tax=Macrolepiota fuliginosa MF-IS2 TaxID=1400762 RepID=A0A9P6C6S1_9AGAR|nr:hypothetical protein P691DRAFT_725687 [Macrolepiota fuliginosa MF-IS2]